MVGERLAYKPNSACQVSEVGPPSHFGKTTPTSHRHAIIYEVRRREVQATVKRMKNQEHMLKYASDSYMHTILNSSQAAKDFPSQMQLFDRLQKTLSTNSNHIQLSNKFRTKFILRDHYANCSVASHSKNILEIKLSNFKGLSYFSMGTT